MEGIDRVLRGERVGGSMNHICKYAMALSYVEFYEKSWNGNSFLTVLEQSSKHMGHFARGSPIVFGAPFGLVYHGEEGAPSMTRIPCIQVARNES